MFTRDSLTRYLKLAGAFFVEIVERPLMLSIHIGWLAPEDETPDLNLDSVMPAGVQVTIHHYRVERLT